VIAIGLYCSLSLKEPIIISLHRNVSIASSEMQAILAYTSDHGQCVGQWSDGMMGPARLVEPIKMLFWERLAYVGPSEHVLDCGT